MIGGCQAKAVESRSYLVVVLGFGADVSRLEVSHEAVSVQVTTGGHRDTQEDESGRSRWQSQVVLAVKVDEKVELTEMTVVLVVEGSCD